MVGLGSGVELLPTATLFHGFTSICKLIVHIGFSRSPLSCDLYGFLDDKDHCNLEWTVDFLLR